MFKQKELPFLCVLKHLPVVRTWLHFLSVARLKKVHVSTHAGMDRN